MPNIDLMGATYPDVPAVTLPSGATTATFYYPDEIDYASSPSSGGNANRANAILYGTVDSTSTATAFTATVDGLTELTDGTTVMLHNGVVTSASGFTVNVNGLGAKPCYNNMTNATRDTTIFNVSYTMLFVYSTALDSGSGGWWIYRGYDGNTNTIGYQLRTNSGNLVASDTGYRYRLWLTSADGSRLVPINTSTSTNATSNRTLNTRPIDPFGPIVYRATNGTCTAGTGIGATAIWQQYTLNIGYSYMASGFSLTAQDSVYLRCTPQTDGSAVMQDIVQTLPTSKDGKIYIHLGTAYNTTNMELTIEHPVYWHDGTGIRLWTGAESGGGPEPSSTAPAMDGTAAVGTATTYARADHVHPTDTSRQATLVSGTNIKTINNESLLGSGNITISGGSGGAKTTWYGTSNTAASTAIKIVTCDGYANETGCIIGILFSTANTNTAPQLRINNDVRGYIITGAAETSPITWEANSMVYVMFNGLDFQLIGIVPQGGASLPIATASTLGGIKVGSGLSVTSDGTLSASGGGSWTDVSADFKDALGVAGVGTVNAYTNGNTVWLSVLDLIPPSGTEIDLPSGYMPLSNMVFMASRESDAAMDDITVSTCVLCTEASGHPNGSLALPEQYSYTFTIIYPIA